MLTKKSGILFFLMAWIPVVAYSGVNIRLMYGKMTDAVIVSVRKGAYDMVADGNTRMHCSAGEMIFISRKGNELNVTTRNNPGFSVSSLLFSEADTSSTFSLRIPGMKDAQAEYPGSLKCSSDLGTIIMINNLEMEDYIAAVVQAEGGYRGEAEYFMTQAIIIRTYAYLHMDKHADDGYNLCDDVHCQVYKGICITPAIEEAVKQTAGLVVTGNDSLLILTPFHSNCGGETSPSEYVWLNELPYLRSVADPYCLYSANATWRKSIPFDKWKDYLEEKGMDKNVQPVSFNFIQNSRKINYTAGSFSYPLDEIRNDLGLRSTFFSVVVEGDSVILSGRGYGHGVGLCQEGAMAMSLRGFNHEQIIKYYYTGVKIMDIGVARIPEKEIRSF